MVIIAKLFFNANKKNPCLITMFLQALPTLYRWKRKNFQR